MTNKPIAIIGAGNGGQTTAAWLANQGYKTRIFDVMEDTVAKLNELGGVNIYGNTDYPGFGKIEFATTDSSASAPSRKRSRSTSPLFSPEPCPC